MNALHVYTQTYNNSLFENVQTIRSVHGVVCNDGFSVSFQPFQKDSEALLHHHSHASSPSNKSTENGYHHENGGGDRTLPRPIEFRRKVIMKSAPTRVREDRTDGPTSPMTKLLNEHEKLSAPKLIPTVEIYPFQLNYQIVDENNPKPNKGFVLVSQTTRIYDALQGLLKVTASKTSSSCKRVWSKRDDGMGSGDGYEVIDLQSLDGKLLRKTGEKERHPQMLTGEWVTRHGAHFEICNMKEINVLVEIRRPNAKWERAEFELENRIKAGDFVDAQDVTGKWFEAQVREVTDDTVKVHYLGWASKWNATIRRRMDVEAAGAPAVSAITGFLP